MIDHDVGAEHGYHIRVVGINGKRFCIKIIDCLIIVGIERALILNFLMYRYGVSLIGACKGQCLFLDLGTEGGHGGDGHCDGVILFTSGVVEEIEEGFIIQMHHNAHVIVIVFVTA